jgi:hypothetical protein
MNDWRLASARSTGSPLRPHSAIGRISEKHLKPLATKAAAGLHTLKTSLPSHLYSIIGTPKTSSLKPRKRAIAAPQKSVENLKVDFIVSGDITSKSLEWHL